MCHFLALKMCRIKVSESFAADSTVWTPHTQIIYHTLICVDLRCESAREFAPSAKLRPIDRENESAGLKASLPY